MENQTEVQDFILLGLTNDHQMQHILFPFFLLLYIASLLGNRAIVAVAQAEPRLHTPMYFFLSNLSWLDIFYSTVTVPKMLNGFLVDPQVISFLGCLTQLHFFYFLGSTEGILLGVMAFDRYVAICNPLRYTVIMNKWVCLLLAGITWAIGFVHGLMHTVVTSRLWFCGPNHVQHFFCDVKPLLKLACSSTTLNLILINIVTGSIALGSFLVTLLSYFYIISFIVSKIQSWASRWKSFSTCASHLTVVVLMYVSVLSNYMLASAGESAEREIITTLMYSAVTPVLNPLIFTLRNQDVKSALKKLMDRKLWSRRI
uniref:olfactory receptor 12D1-like n=1 Tax=Euleptes europaea TaxID=460621 RepID=UPI0025425F79|nr:olfactory receptor 12D1-like [Euleptes europaea]